MGNYQPPTISHKTLSLNLKELEGDGLVLREEYPQIPPKVEYRLSPRGESLIPILDAMCTWGEKNRISGKELPGTGTGTKGEAEAGAQGKELLNP